jgi:hypothetical protein
MDIPIEIYGHILLLAGNIPLLRSINKVIRKNYEKEILRFDLTTPITKREISKYIGNNKPFWLFTQGNQYFIEAREFIYYKRDGCLRLSPNTTMIYHYYDNYEVNRSQIEYNKIIGKVNLNCDINLLYTIVKNRTTSCAKYAKSLCINTINYYCDNSSEDFCLIYLYLNVVSFGFLMLPNQDIWPETLFQGNLNYKKNLLRNELIKRVNSLDKSTDTVNLIMELS